MARRKKPDVKPPVSVVGIGASAGGIEALQKLFRAVPADLGHAYVVIVHLSPDHASELSSILGRCTEMPVAEVHDTTGLEPNHVYVIPPNRDLKITDTSVGATEFEDRQGPRTAVDVFFRSLAANHGDGFAIILSGGGSDGAVGARAVKEAGGVILVQDPEEAMHRSMPESVIAAGVADAVAPVEELARQLADITPNKRILLPMLRPSADRVELSEEDEENFGKVIELMHSWTGHDFGEYKRTTMLRRMARRMQLARATTFGDYLDYLQDNREEIVRLQSDLLITVTTFFRDPEAWEVLRKDVVAPLIQDSDRNDTIRVWVVGCATGEEAYSMAILFREEMSRLNQPRELVIFASDIDEESLATARKGRYPPATAADLSEARLERFFTRQADKYRVNESIRNCVIFAQHSVFRDPPFSSIDLLSCRNLLIYLERQLQDQVQMVFRHACRDSGYLFIGSAEAALPGLFKPVDKQHRIYRMGPRHPEIPLFRPSAPGQFSQAAVKPGGPRQDSALQVLEAAKNHLDLIEKAAPPSMLVDHEGRVLHLSPTAGRYTQLRGGEPGMWLEALLREELRDQARSALERAFADKEPHVSPSIPVRFNGDARNVVMLVHPRPVTNSEERVALVMFLESDAAQGKGAEAKSDTGKKLVKDLREQLRSAGLRIDRQGVEQELKLQDLRAANEELQSLYEEYRSTAEELEIRKEELQSVNEELQTVNAELSTRLDDASRARSDLENLLHATHIPTLFLDRDLCIKLFTPPLTDIFHVRHRDEGRPISDLMHDIENVDLAGQAREVLSRLTPIEYEAKTGAGATLIVRMFPYRAAEDRVDGVVMTFVDITKAKESEKALEQSRRQLESELHVTRRLHQMWMAVTTARSQHAALDEIMEAAIDLLEGDFGTIEVLDPDSPQHMRIAAHRGIPKNLLAMLEKVVTTEGSATERALTTRRQVDIADVLEDEAYAPHRDFATELGYRTAQATPLVQPDGAVIGVLSTMYRQPDAITTRHRDLAELMARQASTLIVSGNQQRHLAELYEQLKERTRLIEANDQQLREQAEELLKQDRAKEEFLNLLGHELRNPLAAIRNSLEAIERQHGPPRDDGENFRERAIAIIDRQSRHMARMVNDLLEISRVNQGKLTLRPQSIDMRQIVADAVATLELDFRKKNLGVELHVPDDPVYARADPERAAQVLDNVLRNAYQFTESGGTVTVSLKPEDGHAHISIKDSGIGMEPEHIEPLFEPYRQAVDGYRMSGGLGLGLSLCRKLMKLHAGEISAHSDGPGRGSEFVMRFPLSKSGPVPQSASEESLHALRVLVVDDDADNASSLAVLLDSLGQETRIAHEGETALQMARDFKPQLVFLDVSMPGMSGIEVARELRGDGFAGQTMTLVGLSGHAPREGPSAFDRYIIKPATLDDIIAALNSTPAD